MDVGIFSDGNAVIFYRARFANGKGRELRAKSKGQRAKGEGHREHKSDLCARSVNSHYL